MQRYSGRISKPSLKRRLEIESEEILSDKNYKRAIKKRIVIVEKETPNTINSVTLLSRFEINSSDEKSINILNSIKQSYKHYLNHTAKKESESIEEFRNYLIILRHTHQDSEYHFQFVKNYIANSCKLGIHDINIILQTIEKCLNEAYKYSFLGMEFFEHTITNFKKDLICVQFIQDKLKLEKITCSEENYLAIADHFIQNQKIAQNVLTKIINSCYNL